MFHQVKAEEMDRLLQDLERQHGWAAALLNASQLNRPTTPAR